MRWIQSHDDCVGGVGGEQAAGYVDGETGLAIAGKLFDDDIVLRDDVQLDTPADLVRQTVPDSRGRQCWSAPVLQQRLQLGGDLQRP